MAGKSKAISDELLKKAELAVKALGTTGEVARRLQAIISAKENGITIVAKIYRITRGTLLNWIKSFELEAEEGLKVKPGRGRKCAIDDEIAEKIRVHLQKDPNLTLRHIKILLEEKYHLKVSEMTVHRLMQRLSLAYITPRPSHYKSDKKLQEAFKKKPTKNSPVSP